MVHAKVDPGVIPQNSDALVIPSPNIVEMRSLPTPVPEPGQALVEVSYSGVSFGTELWGAAGKVSHFGPMPFATGYQCVGRVVSMNGERAGISEGDVVACFAIGSHRRFVAVDFDLVHRLSDSVPQEQAAMFVQPSVAANALNMAKVGAGDTVLVLGQGLVGQATAILARLKGAFVIGTDISPSRLEVSKQHCVDLSIDVSIAPASEQLKSDFPDGVDVVFESTGFVQLLDDAMKCVRKGGTVVFEGYYPDGVAFDYQMPHVKQITAVFPCFIGAPPVREGILRLIDNGRLDLSNLISDIVPSAEAASFYERLFTSDRDRINGVVIDWTDTNPNET
jgi:2-desacetyl-2-hydroxyethyl bacteriochlorophyllide A dehydrogenase